MKSLKKIKRGFTLVELIMIVVILGILAAVAVPYYFDLTTDAEDAAERGVVGGVRAGIQTYFAQNRGFPTDLDDITVPGTTCSASDRCFNEVLSQGGITEDTWEKTTIGATFDYTGPTTTVYTYDPTDGSFE